MQLAPHALTTPARFRTAADCEGEDYSEAVLIRHINAISGRAKSYCGREFGLRVYTANEPWLGQGQGKPFFWVPFSPLKTLSKVILDGTELQVVTVGSSTAIPLAGGKVYRRPDWDAQGKLYYPIGWTQWPVVWGDVTGDLNSNTQLRNFNIRIEGSGGYVLPQYSGKTDAAHNPNTLQTDLPEELEEAIWVEMEHRIARPNRSLLREKTPGGGEWQYESQKGLEFCDQAASVLRSYCAPDAIFQ